MDAKTRIRLIALAAPVAAGVVAALATASSSRTAYIEGPLPVFLLMLGIVAGVLALAAVLVLEAQRPAQQTAVSGSGVAERLQMLERLEAVITGRLDKVDGHLDLSSDPAVGDARAELRRLQRFLNDVHGVASLHDVELELEDVDPADLISAVVSSGAKVAGDRTLEAELPTPAAPSFWADRKLLLLALVNLVVNAVKFSTPHTPIVVRATDKSDRMVFEVVDQGPGIPDGEDVWVELVRGTNAADVPGTGLGLALVRLIAERHGGSADAASTPTGTVARMTIPRS